MFLVCSKLFSNLSFDVLVKCVLVKKGCSNKILFLLVHFTFLLSNWTHKLWINWLGRLIVFVIFRNPFYCFDFTPPFIFFIRLNLCILWVLDYKDKQLWTLLYVYLDSTILTLSVFSYHLLKQLKSQNKMGSGAF